jgi:hypothetical protein
VHDRKDLLAAHEYQEPGVNKDFTAQFQDADPSGLQRVQAQHPMTLMLRRFLETIVLVKLPGRSSSKLASPQLNPSRRWVAASACGALSCGLMPRRYFRAPLLPSDVRARNWGRGRIQHGGELLEPVSVQAEKALIQHDFLRKLAGSHEPGYATGCIRR